MARYLVIVESPAKVKTIKKFLGSNYVVTASNGHVRDLPKSQLGVDVEHDYEPKYITIRGKGEILANLRKEVKKADKVYLATDPDREGEAISWHLSQALKLENKKTYRISFNEITKNAVKASLKNAREIDMDLVDAQQARRILDRIVGYKISPLLWAKVKRGLSAGRVQSVALRIIADREDEIMSDVSGLTVTAEQGSTGEGKIDGSIEDDETVEVSAKEYFANANYVASDSMAKALMEVKSGTADLAVVDSVCALAMVGPGTDYEDLVVNLDNNFGQQEYGIAFRKGSDLTEKVDEAINELYEEGKVDEIAAKYGLEDMLVK